MRKQKLLICIALAFCMAGCSSGGNSKNENVAETKSTKETVAETTTACEHAWGKWKVVDNARCGYEGTKERKCSKCGQFDYDYIKPLKHKWAKKTVKKATATKQGKIMRYCKRCGNEIIKKYSLTKKEKKQYLHEHCQNYSYETIARYPDKYKGKYAKFTGEVVQVIDKGTYRVDVTYEGYGFYTDTIYVELSDDVNLDFNILEDDIITIYGVLAGECSYETVLGANMTIPAFTAYDISVK